MQRDELERLSKDELIELVLRLQRPAKTSLDGHDGCLLLGGDEAAPEFAALAAAFRARRKAVWRAWADVPPR